MQTFLSEHTFEASARALDNKRLNKQLLEGRQILTALAGDSKGWVNHPATRMWAGYEWELYRYLNAIQQEMWPRGIDYTKNWDAICLLMKNFPDDTGAPAWWTNTEERHLVVASHRTNLYHKDDSYYAQYENVATNFFHRVDTEPLSVVCCATRRKGKPCGYYWPTHVGG